MEVTRLLIFMSAAELKKIESIKRAMGIVQDKMSQRLLFLQKVSCFAK